MEVWRKVETPAFLVERRKVESNCARMLEKAKRSGAGFRPHVKTHKTIEGAKLQHGGRIGPITVSTLAEGEFFADAGFSDITYAVPIAPARLARAVALATRVERLNLLIDHRDALEAIESFHRHTGTVLDCFLKVDCGYHRSGVDPTSPETFELVDRLAGSPAIRLRGLLTHAGHSYDARTKDEVLRIAAEEGECLTRLADGLNAGGISGLTRSIGSTPTMSIPEMIAPADEIRPGNYVFHDAFQASLGSCSLDDCAVTVLTTVIGCHPDHLVIDAGALALSKDLGRGDRGGETSYGIVLDIAMNPLPLRLVTLSQEHGKVISGGAADLERFPIGTVLRIIPNHSCLTAAMFDRYVVIENDAIVDEWRPVRGW